MVVFDDDPTGIQTVHGCLLVTDWSEENIIKAMNDEQPFFYVLTNTRALTASEAESVLESAVEAVLKVNEKSGYRLICVSRSDSCLRGHFPLETDIIRRTLEKHGINVWQRTPFCPAFIESGRVTIEGVHYMKVPSASGMAGEETLVPVSETEFARDNVFGYKNARLTDYIIEKVEIRTITRLSMLKVMRSLTLSVTDCLRRQRTLTVQWSSALRRLFHVRCPESVTSLIFRVRTSA